MQARRRHGRLEKLDPNRKPPPHRHIERDGRTINFVIIKKRPHQIRATVTLPMPGNEEEELQLIRAHDGKTVWTATRVAGGREMKANELDNDAAADLLSEAGVLPRLIDLWQSGANLALLPTEMIDGEAAFVIRADREGAFTSHVFYLSSDSYRTIKIKH